MRTRSALGACGITVGLWACTQATAPPSASTVSAPVATSDPAQAAADASVRDRQARAREVRAQIGALQVPPCDAWVHETTALATCPQVSDADAASMFDVVLDTFGHVRIGRMSPVQRQNLAVSCETARAATLAMVTRLACDRPPGLGPAAPDLATAP